MSTSIERHLARTPDGRRLLRLILTGNRGRLQDAEQRVNRFLESAQVRGLSVDLLFGVSLDQRPITGALAVESPGRIGLVLLPPAFVTVSLLTETADALKAASQLAASRGVLLLQCLVEPEDETTQAVLRQAEYDYLATLDYCERNLLSDSPLPNQDESAISYVNYAESDDFRFGSALLTTYQGSLDCPALTGIRDIADVLATHRSCGAHDPELWFVARYGAEDVGVILLSPVPGSDAAEVVYMGVNPSFRGRGLGDVLLGHAQRVCEQRGFKKLILAVDAANKPAQIVYARWNFERVGQREAWIKALHP